MQVKIFLCNLDMRAYSKFVEPVLPTYIDETMTYYNRFNLDTYVF